MSRLSPKLIGSVVIFLLVQVSAFSIRLSVSPEAATMTFDGGAVTASQLHSPSPPGIQAPLNGTFSNPARIAINDSFTPPTTASLYPSTIDVAGQGALSKVTVTLIGLTHSFADDVDVLLAGPSGESCLLMADCGGSNDIHAVDLTFDDDAASFLPDGTLDGTITTGAYKPTKGTFFGDDNSVPVCGFPSPAPNNGATCPGNPFTYSTTLSVFNGTSPNGTWKLYVIDDTSGDDGFISGGWTLTITAPTQARLLSSEAVIREDGRVLVKWETGFESDNLGFNVYREQNGERARVNEHLIAGSALMTGPQTLLTAGHSYRWRDNGVADCGSRSADCQNARYWLEEIDLSGQSTWHGPIDISPLPATGPESDFDKEPSPSLAELNRRDRFRSDRLELSASVAASLAKAMKLSVKRDGYYRVTQQELVAAGFDPDIDPRFLQLFADGREQTIVVQTGKDGRFDSAAAIEFYGTARDGAYSDTHVYRLSAGSQPGLRIKPAPPGVGYQTSGSFLHTAERKDRTIYFASLRNGDKENFFGAVIASQPADETLRLLNVSTKAPGEATLEVTLQGVTQTPHVVDLFLNGTAVGAISFDGQSSGAARLDIPQSMLKEGDNTVRLAAVRGPSDVSLADSIRLSYWHSYTADDNALRFSASARETLTIAGFISADIRVLDITDAESGGVQEVTATAHAQKEASSVSFTVSGQGTRQLIAFASDQVKTPAAITPDYPSTWRQPGNAADLVIIARREFFPALVPLKSWRESQGFSVAIVDVEDIFDEFNNGNKSPRAIRDFLAYSKLNWKTAPRFVLLAGDASLDPKNYLGSGDWDLVPARLIDTAFMETASDDWFADFDDDGLPEMAVGRLPVRTLAEASTVVAKIISYDQSKPSKSVLLVADSNDGFDFERATSALRALIPDSVSVSEIDRAKFDDAAARRQLLDAINRGQKIVNYIGHGNSAGWRGNILTSSDTTSLLNSQRLSLFVSMTCLNGYFQDPAITSLGEALLKSPNGGAVAVWASSGLCDPRGQTAANLALYSVLLTGKKLTLGEAAVKAKTTVSDRDIRRTWILLGDPTTVLR